MSKIGSGAFANVYNSKDGMVLKKYNIDDIKDASKEIDMLNLIKSNRNKFKAYCNDCLGYYNKSSIITIKDWSMEDGCISIKMKKYSCNLNDFLVKYFNNSNKKLDFEISKFIHYKIMLGLMELNFSGIIHGDLKPENIIISIDKQSKKKVKKNTVMNLEEIVNFILKEELKVDGIENIKKSINVKIIDFNKSVYGKTSLKPLDIQTIYYTPPEIIAGNYYYNNSVDIWTASCILFEMLTNVHLFNIYNKSQLSESIESSTSVSSNSKEESECSDNYGSVEDEKFDHLALLHMYNYLLGSYPQELLVNCKYKDIYFTNGALNGSAGFGSDNIKHLFKFNNFFNEILLRTFKYDHRERLTIEEYFNLYVRN